MFESLNALIPKIRSWHKQSHINLDFGGTVGKDRRSSFLPRYWSDEVDSHLSKSADHIYQGATIFTRDTNNSAHPQQSSVITYCTGSQYIGEFNSLGMSGKGVYKFPHGVVYDGYFNKNGEFHGTGVMIYPSGQRVEGIWRNGKQVSEPQCIASDNTTLGTPYCTMPDRRFAIEIQDSLMPATHEYLTDDPVPRPIPVGMYDTCEGYYDPVHHVIVEYIDPTHSKVLSDVFEEMTILSTNVDPTLSWLDMVNKLRECPATDEKGPLSLSPYPEFERWIIDNCRKEFDEPIGYNEDLFEVWTAGYREENRDNISRLPFNTEEDEVIKKLAQIIKPTHNPRLNKFLNKQTISIQMNAEERQKSKYLEVRVSIMPSSNAAKRRVVYRLKTKKSIFRTGISTKVSVASEFSEIK